MRFLFAALVAAEIFGLDLGGDEEINSFFIIGDAVILGNVARIMRDNANSVGGLQSLETIDTGLFELEVVFNITTQHSIKAGVGFWFSSQTQELGPIFGLSHKFEGFGVFLDTDSSTLFLNDIREMSEPNIRSGEKCLISLENTNFLKFYIKSTTFELWIHQNSYRKCAEIKIQDPAKVYFGIYSSGSQIDILKIASIPKPKKTAELSPIHHEISQKLSEVTRKLPIIKQNIYSLFSGPEFEKAHSDIHDLKEKIQKLLKILPFLHKTLSEMHIEDSFTQYTNIEILSIGEQVKEINLRLEDLMDYVDTKKILSEVYEAVEGRYKNLSSHGSLLKKDLKQAEKNFKSFENHFESDVRIFWVHIGLGALLVFSCLMCCKVCASDIPDEE